MQKTNSHAMNYNVLNPAFLIIDEESIACNKFLERRDVVNSLRTKILVLSTQASPCSEFIPTIFNPGLPLYPCGLESLNVAIKKSHTDKLKLLVDLTQSDCNGKQKIHQNERNHFKIRENAMFQEGC